MQYIPGVAKISVFKKKWFVESISTVPPIIAGAVAVWNTYLDPSKQSIAYILAVGIIWLMIASLIRVLSAYSQDDKDVQQKNYEGLRGAVHVLYSSVSRHLKYDENDTARLRITLHRVVYEDGKVEPSSLEQMIPYVGGKGGGEGRSFSISPGIIGHTARTGKILWASRAGDDHEAFIAELISKWFYTDTAARSLTADRQTWMAVPILNKDRNVLVVVYLDSGERDAFDEPTIRLILSSCSGIAAYISQYYSLSAMSPKTAEPSLGTPIKAMVEISGEGASLKETEVVLTGDAQRELTSTAEKINAEAQ